MTIEPRRNKIFHLLLSLFHRFSRSERISIRSPIDAAAAVCGYITYTPPKAAEVEAPRMATIFEEKEGWERRGSEEEEEHNKRSFGHKQSFLADKLSHRFRTNKLSTLLIRNHRQSFFCGNVAF